MTSPPRTSSTASGPGPEDRGHLCVGLPTICKVRPDLNKTNLAHVDLFEMDVSGMVLAGADFTGAQLFGVDLQGANLGGTDFHGATLSQAHMFDVFAGRADFTDADLAD